MAVMITFVTCILTQNCHKANDVSFVGKEGSITAATASVVGACCQTWPPSPPPTSLVVDAAAVAGTTVSGQHKVVLPRSQANDVCIKSDADDCSCKHIMACGDHDGICCVCVFATEHQNW